MTEHSYLAGDAENSYLAVSLFYIKKKEMDILEIKRSHAPRFLRQLNWYEGAAMDSVIKDLFI